METSHAKALQSFACDLQWLLALRLGVQLATIWLFVWGVAILALRIFGTQNTFWLALGLFGVAPLALRAARRARVSALVGARVGGGENPAAGVRFPRPDKTHPRTARVRRALAGVVASLT